MDEHHRVLFIQHTARTYPGQSGGGLFDKRGRFIGLLFKNSILNVNEDKDMRLQLDQMCYAVSTCQLAELFDLLGVCSEIGEIEERMLQGLDVFNCKSERVKELQK